MTGILDFVPPGWTPTEIQKKILAEIEAAWDRYDVMTIIAPTASGKTLISYTIALWAASKNLKANILVPTNILVGQGRKSFPKLSTMHKRAYYVCKNKEHELDCSCKYRRALTTNSDASVRLMNYWTYLAHRRKFYAPVAIFDEGHQVINMLHGMQDLKLWRSQHNFPTDMKYVADLVEWGQKKLENQEDEALEEAIRRVQMVSQRNEVVYYRKKYQGRMDILLSIEPCSIIPSTHYLWPFNTVEKLIFMSATIGPQDMKELGLTNRRIAYLQCDNPIPTKNRPLLYNPTYRMSHDVMRFALPKLIQTITGLLAEYPDKGLIHLPYSLAAQVQGLVDHPRLMFHTQRNKAKVLKKFKKSPVKEGKVLVASGLYEGVDLPYGAARWQLIGKMPFANLGDAWVKKRATEDPTWYAWDTIKKIIQAYGRIVRAVDDYGVTVIADNSFGRLLSQHGDMFPQFILDAIKGNS